MQLPGWLRRVRGEISLSFWLDTLLSSHDLDDVLFPFFFFGWGFLNQSTLRRLQSRGSQGVRHNWAAEQQNSPYNSQCLEHPFRKINTLWIHFDVEHQTQVSKANKSKQKERKANDTKANILTEQSRACQRIVARGQLTSETGPQDGNRNTQVVGAHQLYDLLELKYIFCTHNV